MKRWHISRSGRGRHVRLGLFATLLSGCAASTAELEPVDARRGRIGAHYEIDVGERNWGDARVWSRGAQPLEVNGEEPTAQFSLRIRNDSDTPLRLDLARTELEVATNDHELRIVDEPARFEGSAEIAPESTGRVELDYTLSVEPEDIEGVELSWVVSTPLGPYSQSTSFIPEMKDRGDRTSIIYATARPWYPYRPWRYGPRWWWW